MDHRVDALDYVCGKVGVICPVCSSVNSHFETIQYGKADDMYQIVKQISLTPDGAIFERGCCIKSDYRGDEVRIFFEGECNHRWAVVFSEHKGNVYCRSEAIDMIERKPSIRERYRAYLLSDEWKRLTAQKREEAENKCQLCNDGKSVLHVHHRTYDNVYHETLGDLIVLCEKCHKRFHAKEDL